MRWQIDSDGVIYSPAMARLGYFDVNGDVYDLTRIDAMGFPIGAHPKGFVDINGDTYNETNVSIGFVDSDGLIYNMMNTVVARVDREGAVFDLAGPPIGQVHLAVHKAASQRNHRRMWLRAASAPVLVLQI